MPTGSKHEECDLVDKDHDHDLAWLNGVDQSSSLRYCTEQCLQGGRLQVGHNWDDEDEHIPCTFCRGAFHTECVVRCFAMSSIMEGQRSDDQHQGAEDAGAAQEDFVCKACLRDRVPHLQAYLRGSSGEDGTIPRELWISLHDYLS